MLRTFLIAVLALGVSLAASATVALSQQGDTRVADRILIRSVRLPGDADGTEPVIVNILLRKGRLDVVTRDEIKAEEGTQEFDGRPGFLIGKLRLGEPASFLLLSEDPAENVQVLLDTRTYATFAIHEGEILKNTLPPVSEDDDSRKRTRSGWLAYTPPPMALPTSYRDESKWNRWETKYVSGIFLGAVVLDRQEWIGQSDSSKRQVGELSSFDGGEVRGMRFGAIGSLNFPRPWIYTIFFATNAFDRGFDSSNDDDLTAFDYRLDVPLPYRTTLSVGKQKEPVSLERVMSLAIAGLQERSAAADAMLPSRNVGLVLSGGAADTRVTWAGGVFNDWFDSNQPLKQSATQVVGRVTGLAAVTEDESNILHLGASVRHSNAKEGVRFRTEPEFNKSPDFVDTDLLTASAVLTWQAEATWRKGPYWIGGEYIRSSVTSHTAGDPSFHGYHVAGTWALTGEMRRYIRQTGTLGPAPVARTVYQGGHGAWELATRWSDLDLTDGAIDGGRMRIFSLGVNWWLTPFFQASVNYRHIRLDRLGTEGRSDGINTRLLLSLE